MRCLILSTLLAIGCGGAPFSAAPADLVQAAQFDDAESPQDDAAPPAEAGERDAVATYPDAGTDAQSIEAASSCLTSGICQGAEAGSCCPGYACGADQRCALGCMIGDVTVPAGSTPGSECLSCQPNVSTSEWSASADGTPCTTGGQNGTCSNGSCIAGATCAVCTTNVQCAQGCPFAGLSSCCDVGSGYCYASQSACP